MGRVVFNSLRVQHGDRVGKAAGLEGRTRIMHKVPSLGIAGPGSIGKFVGFDVLFG